MTTTHKVPSLESLLNVLDACSVLQAVVESVQLVLKVADQLVGGARVVQPAQLSLRRQNLVSRHITGPETNLEQVTTLKSKLTD